MAEISASMVKELRERTGAGMMQCKQALAESEGNLEKATEILRKMGLAQVAKRADRVAAEGRIESYVHPGNKTAVLVEVNSETDFVARTDDFVKLCHEVALQVAAVPPRWVTVEDVPTEEMERQKVEARARLAEQGIAAADLDSRVEKEVQRFLEEQVLLCQPWIKDGAKTMQSLLQETAAKLGENLRVSRFSYFRLGGGQ